ncbi:MAG: carboxylating nicotinate-nucleotide diphosphorylase [Candidatus Kapaibacterium sp.]|nr:MAG: carboxylating nicotinate-nucleotide diphosphorylase [Candidatus Kapabacteria bacterium]
MVTTLTIDSVLPLVRLALQEDIADGDVTTNALFAPEVRSNAHFLVKQAGVVCGISLPRMVIEEVAAASNDAVHWQTMANDGDEVPAGMVIATVEASARTLLQAERTALNFLQRMCGVATLTKTYVRALDGTGTRVIDTRKTIPGWRLLDKYAVQTGGGKNHRFGLFDMALIKDNHRDAAGSLTNAIRECNHALKEHPHIFIEAETRTLADVREVLECLASGLKVQRIMFDNFPVPMVAEGVRLVGTQATTEASGGITLANIREYAETGVHEISVGALTHSAPALDISMKFL